MTADKLVLASGRLVWTGMGLEDSRIKVAIGDYRAYFEDVPQSYEFTFSDLNAVLEVSGDGRALSRNAGDGGGPGVVSSDAGCQPYL